MHFESSYKIALLVPSLRNSGPIIGVYTLAQYYVREGIFPDIIALSSIAENESLEADFRGLGVDVTILNTSIKHPLSLIKTLRTLIQNKKYKLVHSTGFRPDIFLSLVRNSINSLRILSTVRSELYNDLKFEHGAVIAALSTRAWVWAFSRFDVVVPHSLAIKEALCSYGVRPSQMQCIYNGVDTVRFRPPSVAERKAARARLAISDDTVVIGHVGHITKLKGVEYIVEALAQLPRDSNIKFISVGVGDQRESLEGRSRALGISDKIIWAGKQTDVMPYLYAMDIFTLPSWTEGLPRALMEACATGLPAVVSDIQGCREVVVNGGNGLCVVPGNASALSTALMRLILSRELRRSMGESARARVEQTFSAEAMATGYLKLYEQLGTR